MFKLEGLPGLQEQLDALSTSDPPKYEKVWNALQRLAENPRHQSLNTHKWHSEKGLNGEQMFVAYVENDTPRAWRILFYYPKQTPSKAAKKKKARPAKVVKVYAVLPHP